MRNISLSFLVMMLAAAYLFVLVANAPRLSFSPFYAEFTAGGSLAVQVVDDYITITLDSGTLNSSNSLIWGGYEEGYFLFNSSSSGSLSFTFNNTNVHTSINGTRIGSYIASGDTLAFGAYDSAFIEWDRGIIDLTDLYTMPFIGLSGMVLLCFGAFAGALQVRNFSNESSDSLFMIGIYFVIAIIGAALIVVWLWP